MKLFIYFLIAGVLLFPIFSLAATAQCLKNGYTVATINGIFTEENGARGNLYALADKVGGSYQGEVIDYQYLLNPPHLGGLGDILKSVYQGLFDKETVQDYDLVEMLRSASEKVKTQKLLLVAHSQGNFYANSFYDTVAGHVGGVSAESIGVYSVATPSGRVAGGGGWITSDTDQVIAGMVGRALHRPIMKPNTHIVLEPGDDSAGHNFSSVYLKYRGAEIVAGIGASLDRLRTNDVQEVEKPCLAPPKLTLGHKIEGVAFAVADPVADAGNAAVKGIATGMYDTGRNALAVIGARISGIMNPKTLFGVAGTLYGTSVAQKDLQDDAPQQHANQGQPVPSVGQSTKSNGVKSTPIAPDVIAQTPIPTLSPKPTPTRTVPPSASSRFAFVAASLGGSSGGSGSGSGGIGIVEGNTPAIRTSTGTAAMSAGIGTATTTAATTSATTASSKAATTTASTSTTSPSTQTSDTAPPDISFTVSTCAASLSPTGCLVATTSIAMNWRSAASDFDHYSVNCTVNGAACANFSLASSTATSTIFTASDNTTYIFSAAAINHVGNISAAVVKTVSVATHPVVINEIAWGGTSSSRSEDEWIELYNITDYDIPLANWVLRSATYNTPYIKLGLAPVPVIARKGYFVLERTDDTTISDITAHQIYTGGLGNGGEVLELSYASTTMDKTPAVCGSTWCAGSAGPNYLTMERYDPYSSGDDQTNWGSWAGFGASSKNAENAPLHGTPGRRNSVHYLINKNLALTSPTILKKSNSPYVLTPNSAGFSGGVGVDIESGVVIKFLKGSSLAIDGVLKTHGTAAEPVVFTSINDDEYGGDVNGDGSTTTPPRVGDWNTIQPQTSGSVFDHAIIRYGGNSNFGSVQAQLQASNIVITITNSVSEFSATGGVRFTNVSGQVSSSSIHDTNSEPGYFGMYAIGGSLVIRHNVFQRNGVGLVVYGSTSPTVSVSGNTFTDNSDPIDYHAGLVSFSGNSATNNTLNGIVMKGTELSGRTIAPDLPYIIGTDGGMAVSSGADSFTVLPGAIIKFKEGASLVSYDGGLNVRGTTALPVVFTSVHDDDCGVIGGCGDTDNATTSAQAGDWWTVMFRATSAGSATSFLDHVIVRYGGKNRSFRPEFGAIEAYDAPVQISNAAVEKSYFAGMTVSGTASTTITGSVIRDNRDSFGGGTAYGISLTLSANPFIRNTHFVNNGQHIATSSASWINGGGNVFE